MAIAKKPIDNELISNSNQLTTEQQSFINNLPKEPIVEVAGKNKKKIPVLLRIDEEVLERIDRAAKSIGLKRAAFLISSAVERSNRMDSQ